MTQNKTISNNPQKSNTTYFSVNNSKKIILLGSILYILLAFYHIMDHPSDSIQWQGIVSQAQVIISVYLVIRAKPPRGYYTAVILNALSSISALMFVFRTNSLSAIPGIVIPLCTIIIISVISFYMNHFNQKAEEVVEERAIKSKEISELQEVSIMAMAALAETRDDATGKHIQRTKLYVQVLAEYLSKKGLYKELLNKQMIELIIASAPLHDIGKVGIPDSILLKPGKLTTEEFEIIKLHTSLGYDAIVKAENLMGADETFLRYARDIVLYHHERWDGNGYLMHLKGEKIPLSARIMSVADVYDALTSERVYKDIQSHEESLDIIREEAGKQFDPEVVKAFLACSDRFKEISETYRDHHI